MTIKQWTKKINDHFYYKNVRNGKYDALPDDKYISKILNMYWENIRIWKILKHLMKNCSG